MVRSFAIKWDQCGANIARSWGLMWTRSAAPELRKTKLQVAVDENNSTVYDLHIIACSVSSLHLWRLWAYLHRQINAQCAAGL